MLLSNDCYLYAIRSIAMDKWLDILLDDAGMTPSDLARATGLDTAVISNIRNGKRGLGIKTATLFASALGRDVSEILKLASGKTPAENKEDKWDREINKNKTQLFEDYKKLLAEFSKSLLKMQREKENERKRISKDTGSTE